MQKQPVWTDDRDPDWDETVLQKLKGQTLRKVWTDSDYLTLEFADGHVAVVKQIQVTSHKTWFDVTEVSDLGQLVSIESLGTHQISKVGEMPVKARCRTQITGTTGSAIVEARKEHDGTDTNSASFRFALEIAHG